MARRLLHVRGGGGLLKVHRQELRGMHIHDGNTTTKSNPDFDFARRATNGMESSYVNHNTYRGIQSLVQQKSHELSCEIEPTREVSKVDQGRLALLGTLLLKYYTTVMLFCQLPPLSEESMHRKRMSLMKKILPLSSYSYHFMPKQSISTEAMADGKRPPIQEQAVGLQQPAMLDLTNILNLGTVFLDSDDTATPRSRVIEALRKIFLDVEWVHPCEKIDSFAKSISKLRVSRKNLSQVENHLNYYFRHKGLLQEALTRTNLKRRSLTYQRLEFLGDAVIDRIVAPRIYNAAHLDQAAELNMVHTALVNKYFFAFLALDFPSTAAYNPHIHPDDKESSSFSAPSMSRRLIDFVTISPDTKQFLQRDRAEATYRAQRDIIKNAFKSGTSYPWTLLQSIDTSKVYSDVLESLIGAVYVDSGGNIPTCEQVLVRFGFMDVLKRFEERELFDSRTPLILLQSRLGDRNQTLTVKRKRTGALIRQNKKWKTVLSTGDQMLSQSSSTICSAHADNLAAEAALAMLDQEVHNSEQNR